MVSEGEEVVLVEDVVGFVIAIRGFGQFVSLTKTDRERGRDIHKTTRP